MPSLSTWLEGHLVEATDVSPVVVSEVAEARGARARE